MNTVVIFLTIISSEKIKEKAQRYIEDLTIPKVAYVLVSKERRRHSGKSKKGSEMETSRMETQSTN